MLLLVTLSTIYLDYWEYSKSSYQDPEIFNQFLRGKGNAPQQYRIGVLKAAELVCRFSHLGLRHAITLIDLIAALGAVFLLLSCLERMPAYRAASLPGKGFACAVYLVLVQFYFGWAIWFQRPETFTTALSVALLLWLMTARNTGTPTSRYVVSITGTLLVACVQALVRADVVLTLEAGVILLCLANKLTGTALPRWLQAATSMCAILLAGGVQIYIMHVLYPHATYGDVKMFQLKMNLLNPFGIFPFCLFMTPFFYLLYRVPDGRLSFDRPSLLLLPGSILFLGLWCLFGRIDEVRIMLPYTLALAPLLATVLMQQVIEPPRQPIAA